jgi:hypothetical protein
MLYESPCDVPGYYDREYHHSTDEDEYDDFSSKDLEDQLDELLEVNWESPR